MSGAVGEIRARAIGYTGFGTTTRRTLSAALNFFRGRVVDVAPESLIIEVSGTVDKIDGLIEVLRPFGVLEMARSGRISMTRGGDLLQPPPQDAPFAAV